MRSSKTLRVFAAVAALAVVGAACGDDDDGAAESETTEASESEMTDDADAMEESEATGESEAMGDEAAADDIVAVASGADNLTTLVAAVQAAELVETLQGDGPFTVFAPTDEAFAAALEELGMTADELLADDSLADILTYHVVADEIPASAAVEAAPTDLETVNGATISVTVDDSGNVMVNDATVVSADVGASNGVVHVIDAVLLPPA